MIEGRKVFVVSSHGWRNDATYVEGVITRVTPTGVITVVCKGSVEYRVRFGTREHAAFHKYAEYGQKYGGRWIDTEMIFEERVLFLAQRERADKIEEAINVAENALGELSI